MDWNSELFGSKSKAKFSFDDALRAENVSGRLADVARSIYQQESGSGSNTRTSNAGAVGGMQIIPGTFQRVADKGWDINNPEHNLRAGIRYLKTLAPLAGDKPELIAAGYYGGEGAIPLAAKGQALRDPRNPNAPDTLQYGAQVASRLPRQGQPVKESAAATDWNTELFGGTKNEAVKQSAASEEKPKAKSRLDTYLENQKKVGKALAVDLPAGSARGIAGIGSNIVYLGDKAITSIGNLFSDKVADTGVTGLVTGQKSADTPEFRNAERKSKIDDFAADRGADPQSLAYKGGKVGAEIAATLPVGGLLARGATAVAPSLARVAPGAVEAVRTAGFSTGRAVAPGVLNAAKDLAIRAGGGAVTGGVSAGLIDPEQADTGAAVGAGLSVALSGAGALGNLAGRAVSGARSLAEPFYESGRQQILSRALRESAGGGQYADDAALRLAEESRPAVGPFMPGKEKSIVGELVPGSVPTAAQIAQNPGLAAMERAATATNPAVLVEHGQRIANQNQSRVNALQDIAGSDGARDFARANLSATADDLYKNAFDKGMNLSRNAATGGFTSKAEQAGIKGEITKLMKTPAMQDAVAQAKVMMQNEMKKTGDPAGSVLGLHYVKKALDDMIERAGGRNEQRILINLRDRMLTTVDRLSPEYSAARSVFRDMARPVNEMDTAAEIAKRAINPGTDRMTLHSFSRALDDKTAAKATGFNKATIEGTFSNENLNVLNAIRDDLRRADFAMNAGRGPGSNTVQNLAYTNMLSQSGVPNFIRGSGPAQVVGNLLKRSGDLAYAKANQQLSEDLAKALLSPGDTAELLRKSTPAQRNAIKALLESPAMIHAYRSAPALAANR